MFPSPCAHSDEVCIQEVERLCTLAGHHAFLVMRDQFKVRTGPGTEIDYEQFVQAVKKRMMDHQVCQLRVLITPE
jgi:hypothetical protein